jgi:hypothetical protein
MVYEMKVRNYIILILVASVVSSCHLNFINCMEGSGEVVRITRNVSDFDKINLNGGFDLNIKQGDSVKLEIEIDQNLEKFIRTNVEDRELEIIETKSICTKIKRAYLTVPNLKKINISGSGEIYSKSPLNFNYLEIQGNGASEIRFAELNCPNLSIDLSGAGDVRINKGKGENLSVRTSGASDIRMSDFQTDSTKVEISGAGDVNVWVNTFLLVKIFGAGDVKYRGTKDTKIVEKIMGTGSVKKIE